MNTPSEVFFVRPITLEKYRALLTLRALPNSASFAGSMP